MTILPKGTGTITAASAASGSRVLGVGGYRPERVVEKMMFKENWTNLPGTFAQIKRFFIGAKDQEAPAEKVQQAAAAAAD